MSKKNSEWHSKATGENSCHWKGGITPLCKQIRDLEEYEQWRMDCFKRDWFVCVECGSKEKLEVHHRKAFKDMLAEFLKEYDQFSPIDDKETLVRLAIKYEPFWDIDNGKTLCIKCHNLIKGESWQ